MKLILKIISIILIGFGLVIYGINNKELTMNEKIEDFEFMYEDLKENYPYLALSKRMYGSKFSENKEKYIDLIRNTKNDEEYIQVLNKIIGDLKNSHTRILTTDEYLYYKEVYNENSSMMGWYNHNREALNNKNSESFYKKTEKENGIEKDRSYNEVNVKRFTAKDIVKNQIGYIELPTFLGRDSIKDEIAEVYKYLQEVKNHEALILDIRGNGGGDTNQWIDLLSLIIDKPYKVMTYNLFREGSNLKILEESYDFKNIKNLVLEEEIEEIDDFSKYTEFKFSINPHEESIKFKGNIYLLVDKTVYSSSEALAIMIKESNLGTLVGETTGGDGIGSDPIIKVLPNSGILYQYTKEMGILSSGEINEEMKTRPHVSVDNIEKTKDMSKDFCIKEVIELEKNS